MPLKRQFRGHKTPSFISLKTFSHDFCPIFFFLFNIRTQEDWKCCGGKTEDLRPFSEPQKGLLGRAFRSLVWFQDFLNKIMHGHVVLPSLVPHFHCKCMMWHKRLAGADVGVVEKHLLMGCEGYFRELNRDWGCAVTLPLLAQVNPETPRVLALLSTCWFKD